MLTKRLTGAVFVWITLLAALIIVTPALADSPAKNVQQNPFAASFYALQGTPEPTGTISGTVTDGSGNPLENIGVDVEQGGYGACTDANGNYTLNLPLGVSYKVYAGGTFCGPHPYQQEWWQETPNSGSATPISLTVGTPDVSAIDFTLDIGGTVVGTVTDQSTGLPIENVGVNADFQGYGFGVCTDASGHYTLMGIPTDQPFRVHAGGGGGCGSAIYVQEFWQEVAYWDQATLLTATSGAMDLTGIDFTLEAGGTITGTVTDQDTGLPIQNMSIDIDQGGFGTCTDSNGNYTLILPLGASYKVFAGANFCGPHPYQQEWWQESANSGGATPIPLSVGTPDVTGIDFTLEPGGTITGTVTDQATGLPIPNVNVNADDNGHGVGACTDENGHYFIQGLSLDVPLRVNAAGGSNWCGGGIYVQEFWQETVNSNNATLITLTSGARDVSGIDFTLEPGGMISGVVTTQATGDPIHNINVNVSPEGASYGFGACTDATGHYEIYGVPLNMALRADSAGGDNWCGGGRYVHEYWQDKPFYYLADPFTLTPGSPNKNDVNFTLESGGTISGTVTDAVGNPLVNIGVDTEVGGSGDCTDSNGHYTLTLTVGTSYKIYAGGTFCGPHGYIKEWWQETASQNSATPIPLTVGTPDVSGIDFTLDLGGTVSGTIFDQTSGQPLANLNVSVNLDDYGIGTCTDALGHYTVIGVPLDTPVRVNAAGGHNWCGGGNYQNEYWQETSDWGQATLITLTSGSPDATGIDFTLEPGGAIYGFIHDEFGAPQGGVPVDTSPGGHGTCSNSDGSYALEGLTLGTPVNIRAGGVQWGGCPNQQFAQEFYQDVFFEFDATPLTPTSGTPNINGIDIVLGHGGSISGHITDGDAMQPLPNVQVDVLVVNPSGIPTYAYLNVCTDSNGDYTLHVPEGSYKVTAGGTCNGQVYHAYQFWNGVSYPAMGSDVIVSAGNPNVTGIDFTLYAAGRVHGTVREAATGNPVPFIGVQIYLPFTGEAVCTDANGNYDVYIDALDVPFTMVVPSPVPSGPGGYWNGCPNKTPYVFEYWQETPNENEATAVTFTQAYRDLTADFTLDMGATVSGHVHLSDGTTPLTHDVSINLIGMTVSDTPGVGINSDGSYTIFNVRPGDYQAMAVPFGQDLAAEFYNEAGPEPSTATIIHVTTGAVIENIDFTLEPGGTISGTIVDEHGDPLPGIVVSTLPWLGNCSDAQGHYFIDSLPRNMPLKLFAQPGNWGQCSGAENYAAEWWDNAGTENRATAITLTDALYNRTGIDFAMEPGGSITGQLLQADGITPYTGWSGWLSVRAFTYPSNEFVAEAQLNPDGSFVFTGLRAGQYRVDVIGDDIARKYYNNAVYLSDLTPVTVTAGATTQNINFTIEPSGTISGHITDAAGNPLANIHVTPHDGWLGGCSDSNGAYTLTNVPLNTPFKIWAGGSSNWCGGSSEYTREWWLEQDGETSATPITLTSVNPNRGGIDFTLIIGGTISGTVKDTGGTPLASIAVETEGGAYGTCTDENGAYTLVVPLDVAQKVRAGASSAVCPEGSGDYALEWWQETADIGTATPVTPTVASPYVSGIDFTLEVGGVVSGVITEPPAGQPVLLSQIQPFAPGDPIPNINVSADFNGFSIDTCTDAAGQYVIPGLPFDQPFVLHAGGDLSCGGQSYVETAYQSGTPIVVTHADPDQTDVDLVVITAGTVSGTVNNSATGLVVPNMIVRLDSGVYTDTICTNAYGYYIFSGVPLDGSYTVSAGGANSCTGGSAYYRQEWWQETGGSGGATTVTVNVGAPDAGGIDFTLQPTADGNMTVTLQGRPPAPDPRWVTSLHVIVTRQSDGSVLYDGQVMTSTNGTFSLTGLDAGAVQVWVKGSHTLTTMVSTTLAQGVNTVSVGTLREGDADDNDKVNISDFAILALTFGKTSGQPGYDGRADFNGDGAITILDFSLLALNFGQVGAAP